jgi:hypothetical protein
VKTLHRHHDETQNGRCIALRSNTARICKSKAQSTLQAHYKAKTPPPSKVRGFCKNDLTMSIITQILDKTQYLDTFLAPFGFHIDDVTESLIPDTTIYPGTTVYFYDDETDAYGFGIYEGFHQDMQMERYTNRTNKTAPRSRFETSPYFSEASEEIERVEISEVIINPDGHMSLRRNYILVDNVYHWMETHTTPFTELESL